MRKLASVRVVDGLSGIEGADRIEVAHIGGWNMVVQKNAFTAGMSCVFFEIDSMLPLGDPRFSFLETRGSMELGGRKYHRLKTMRLKGVVSQGLILPLKDFSETELGNLEEKLGILKYEPPSPGGGTTGPFPTCYGSKTDAERVQNLENYSELAKLPWVASEKVDGTSCSVFLDLGDNKLHVCGRNWEIKDGENLYWKATRKFGVENTLKELALKWGSQSSVGLQFEIFGPGIQKNPLQVPELKIAIFTGWSDRIKQDVSFLKYCAPVLDIPLPPTVEGAVVASNKLRSKINPEQLAEGIVWHCNQQEPIKSINNAYLLKTGN